MDTAEDREEQLSQYIDLLNEGKADLYLLGSDDLELAELFETVNMIKAMREEVELPSSDYVERVAAQLREASKDAEITEPTERHKKSPSLKTRNDLVKRWIRIGSAAMTIILACSLLSNQFIFNTASADNIKVLSEVNLVDLGLSEISHPVPINDGEQVMFEKNDQLWIWNAADGTTTSLPLEKFLYMRDPAISPDGKQVAFSGYIKGSPAIWIMNIDGSHRIQITYPKTMDEAHTLPAWSPDGKSIAFTSTTTASNDPHGFQITDQSVWIIGMNGQGLQRIGTGAEPSWSPIGNQLAVTRVNAQDESIREIWILDIDGLHEEKLTEGTDPSWSPNGQFIAYSKYTSEERQSEKLPPNTKIVEGHKEIWAIHIGNKTESRLTASPVNNMQLEEMLKSYKNRDSNVSMEFRGEGIYSDWNPTWSKDNKQILFLRDVNDEKGRHFGLYRLDLKFE